MTTAHDQAKLALRVYAEGQALTAAWHARMAEKDQLAPRSSPYKDDPKRGCVSPLGGLRPFFPKAP